MNDEQDSYEFRRIRRADLTVAMANGWEFNPLECEQEWITVWRQTEPLRGTLRINTAWVGDPAEDRT